MDLGEKPWDRRHAPPGSSSGASAASPRSFPMPPSNDSAHPGFTPFGLTQNQNPHPQQLGGGPSMLGGNELGGGGLGGLGGPLSGSGMLFPNGPPPGAPGDHERMLQFGLIPPPPMAGHGVFGMAHTPPLPQMFDVPGSTSNSGPLSGGNPMTSNRAEGVDYHLQQQPQEHQAAWHQQQQQQQHQDLEWQQHARFAPSDSLSTASSNSTFELSNSLLRLNLNRLDQEPPQRSLHGFASDLSAQPHQSVSAHGAIGTSKSHTTSSSGNNLTSPVFGSGFGLESSDLTSGRHPTTGLNGSPFGWNQNAALLREEMNQNMASLYQHQARQPLASSGGDLLSLLNHSSQEFQQQDLRSRRNGTDSGTGRGTRSGDGSGLLNGKYLSSSPVRNPFASMNGNGNAHANEPAPSTVQVSPECTEPNETIRVMVSLAASECVLGRNLMIGLFRTNQSDTEKPIFMKKILFENKLNRRFRFVNTKITFRSPRSPGVFEFRVFEEAPTPPGNASSTDDSRGNGQQQPRVIITRSNILKVMMDVNYFMESLESHVRAKFEDGLTSKDAGLVLSSIVTMHRLCEQVDTLLIDARQPFCELIHRYQEFIVATSPTEEVDVEDDKATGSTRKELRGRVYFEPSNAIPSPVESFHSLFRNLLNLLQVNRHLMELLANSLRKNIETLQNEFYCQVSGLFFVHPHAKWKYWRYHLQIEPAENLRSDAAPDSQDGIRSKALIRDDLTKWILEEAHKLIPDSQSFRRVRQEIFERVLAEAVSKLRILDCADRVDLDVFGSSNNDFGMEHSDMDMCLVLPSSLTSSDKWNHDTKQQILKQLVTWLEKRPDLFGEIDTCRLSARIPIVMFKDLLSNGIDCDLCVENVLAQRNTAFLRVYANADPRVRPLAYVLKQFVKRRRMNCAAEGTLSSYGYLLMLIHYLQRTEPPVLPVLQVLPPNWNGTRRCNCTLEQQWCPVRSPWCHLTERVPEMNLPSRPCSGPNDDESERQQQSSKQVHETYFFEPINTDQQEKLRSFGANNQQTVGELLMGFFEYFGMRFDCSKEVVSVRMARKLWKQEKIASDANWRLHNRLSIEDPFEISYDVAHVLKGARYKYIRQQFARAYCLLANAALTRDPTTSDDQDQHEEEMSKLMAKLNEQVTELPFHTALSTSPSPKKSKRSTDDEDVDADTADHETAATEEE